jgi:enamine deaminase RidA (YjgF/YER057c/UK114 family)
MPVQSIPGAVFTQAIKVPAQGSLVFVSGITARDATGNIIGIGDIEAQTRQVLTTISRILVEAGGSLQDVVKIATYLRHIDDLPTVGRIRREYFGTTTPASTSVEVSRLADPRQLVEIDAVAVVTGSTKNPKPGAGG